MYNLLGCRQQRWAKVHCIFLLFCFFFYCYRDLNFYLWQTIAQTYMYVIPVLIICFYFYFIGLKGPIEIKLIWGYGLCLFVTRILNGDIWLQNDFSRIYEFVFLAMFLTPGLLLEPEKRKKFLVIVSIGTSLLFTVISVIGIYAAIFKTGVVNPFSPSETIVDIYGGSRLFAFGSNPNVSAPWFFISFWMLIYLFVVYRHWIIRTLIILVAYLNYTAICLTYSRNVFVGLSVSLSLLAGLVVYRLLEKHKLRLRVLCLVLTLCVTLPLSYLLAEQNYFLYESISDNFSSASVSSPISQIDDPSDIAVSQDDSSGTAPTSRGFEDNGRFEIYLAVFKALGAQPSQLIFGNLADQAMDIVNQMIPPPKEGPVVIHPHAHNSYLHVLLTTGLSGFLFMMAFLVALLLRMLKLYFCSLKSVKLEQQ
ncbi:MAG: O-antigen ligase family protein, partial [Oscillospiraceae bacterium]|nr:O-antigen ligase family protein [Oscillospiraceae bacterium]